MTVFLRNRPGFVLVIVIAATTGCNTCHTILGEELNPVFCRAHTNDRECQQSYPDAAPDAPKPCTGDPDCTDPTKQVCDLVVTNTCVECTVAKPRACMGTTPVCSANNVCRGCQADSECTSQVCDLPPGSCANEATVWYASPTGSGNTCSRMQSCQLMTAIGLVDSTMKTIRMLPDKYTEHVTIADKTVTIHGDGADLTAIPPGEILHVNGSADVSLLGLHIHGGMGAMGDGILCINTVANSPTLRLQHVTIDMNGGAGLDATNCFLTVSQSTLSSNTGGGITASKSTLTISQSTVSGNMGGGISVSGIGTAFDITNTFIFKNGDGSSSGSMFGGLNLGITVAGSNRLAFNTIVDNAAINNSGGVICNVATFMGPNNIIARNTLAGSATDPAAQTSGACTYPTSRIQSDVNGLAFQQPDTSPFSYKLLAGSSAVDQATTAVPIDVDNEGDHRPQGPEKDIGADEFKP